MTDSLSPVALLLLAAACAVFVVLAVTVFPDDRPVRACVTIETCEGGIR